MSKTAICKKTQKGAKSDARLAALFLGEAFLAIVLLHKKIKNVCAQYKKRKISIVILSQNLQVVNV